MKKKYAAICIYRCYRDGVISKSIDVKAMYYECESEEDVRLAVIAEGDDEYRAEEGHLCTWKLQEIMSIDKIDTLEHGDEIVGFISDDTELLRDAWENEDYDG